ncbi:MAG: SDR family oxidoreductase [Myxococcota bacterium]
MPNLSDHRALVTGASSGIGAEMAKILASWGCALTITARRRDRLEALAESLRQQYGVAVRCAVCDLSESDGVSRLCTDLADAGDSIDILINNAGFGSYQAFAQLDWSAQARMIQLNVTSLVELCHRLLPAMLASEKRCYILNVASIAAYQPVPYFACYAATKSYVRDFSEALAHELADSNVSVTSVCPGGTWTEFMDHSGQKLGRLATASMMSAESVARIGLRAMLRRRRNIVTGFMNAITCFLVGLLPRRLAASGSVAVLGRPQPAQPTATTTGATGDE